MRIAVSVTTYAGPMNLLEVKVPVLQSRLTEVSNRGIPARLRTGERGTEVSWGLANSYVPLMCD